MPPALQTRSENPLSPAYWLGLFDARPLAMFRIALGAILLQDLWPRARDASTFLTDDGIFPRALLPQGHGWSLLDVAGGAAFVQVLLALCAAATTAFTLGYATRVSTVLTWLLWLSIHRRVPIIHTGGDSVIDILLFFGVFADLSGRWSISTRYRRGRRADVPALAPRFMQWVPALLYLYTARQKVKNSGAEWWFGSVIFKTMHMHGWIRAPGAVAGRAHPGLCAAFTGGTIVVEFVVAFLLLSPVWVRYTRPAGIAMHLGLQGGILMTMKVGVFTYVMLAVTALWLLPGWLDAIGGPLARKGDGGQPPWTRARMATAGLLGVLFFGTIASPIIPRHIPGVLVAAIYRVGLDLPTTLFTKGTPAIEWEAWLGVLADGSPVDPLPSVAPTADFSDGFFNSLWMQVPYRMED